MILNSLKSVWRVLVFGTLFVTTTFSILVFAFYNEYSLKHNSQGLQVISGELPEFNNLPTTMLHMFLFEWALNQPTLWVKIYKHNPYHAILWLILLFVMGILLQNILLSTISNHYIEIEEEVVLSRVSRIKEKITETYQIVSSINPTHDFVTKKQLKYIYNKFNYQQSSLLYHEQYFEAYWLYANDQRQGRHMIERTGWYRFCLIWFSTIHLENKRHCNQSIKAIFAKRVISKLTLADLIFGIYAIIQSILLLYRLHVKHDTQWIVAFIELSNTLWIMEMLLRIYVLGCYDYLTSRHVFNGFITFLIIFIQLTHTSLMDFKRLNIDDDLNILRLGFAVITLTDINQGAHKVLYSTGHALRAITIFVFVMVLIQISLATIGMELFANIINFVQEHKDDEGPNAKWSGLSDDAKSINFDTFWSSFNLVNVIFYQNDFQSFMFWYKDQMEFSNVSLMKIIGPGLVVSYFIFAFIFQVYFLCNLLTSVFLGAYEFFTENWVDSNALKRIRHNVGHELQHSADVVAPNKYVVQYWYVIIYIKFSMDLKTK